MGDSLKQPKRSMAPLTVVWLVVILAAVLLGPTLIGVLREPSQPQLPLIVLPPQTVKRPPDPEEIAKPHLNKAEKECDRIIAEQVKSLDTFFAESKKNTRAFAEDALGWGSKRRLIEDVIPFGNRDKHREFIRSKFEEHVFKPEQLEEAVTQVVKGYLAHVRSIESNMLVELRADTNDFPSTYPINRLENERLQERYDASLAMAATATGGDLQRDVGKVVVSSIAGQVLTQVAIRLVGRTGILAVGAASGTFTFGVGFVVSLIVDQIVTFVWDWYSDPKGQLSGEIDKKLDEMKGLLVDGSTTDVNGLKERLREFARERAATRHKAVISLLQPTGGQN